MEERRERNSRPEARRPGEGRPNGSRPQGSRPSGSRPGGSRPNGNRQSAERPGANRPSGNRPQGNRPNGNRPAGSRPNGSRPQGRRRPNSKRRRQKRLITLIFFFIILLIGTVAGTLLWKKYSPSKVQANLKEYYGLKQEEQLAVIVDNEISEAKGMMIDGRPYVSYEAVRDHINSRFYWDPNENILLYTLPRDMVTVEVGSSEYSVSKNKQSEDYVILKTEGSTAYIAIDFIKKYTNMTYEVYKNPNRIVVNSGDCERIVAAVKSDTQVRYKGGVKSPILTEVKKKEQVVILENEGNWKKVRTDNGLIGYMKASKLKKQQKETVSRPFEEEEFTNISEDYKINLAWHQVTSKSANNNILQTIAKTKGVTTLSPTWFSVKDNKGNITSLASSDYVNYAHQSNIDVWALVDNFNENVDTYELLSRTSSRENLINQLISEVLQNGIDGINVDFENLSTDTGEHFIQFIRELSIKCRQNGIVLSVDNYVPKGYNSHYNLKEQGIVADYVIIMGYDEHFSGSLESGSVASIGFVEEGIKETLKKVPKEKVINGVPFFTRLWKEVPKTEGELSEDVGTDAEEYTVKVTSEAMGMTEAAKRVKDAGAEITWDKATAQNYAQWESDGATYKIWLEDHKSLEEKLKLMKEYKLAGTAAWKLGFESSDTWELILKYVN